MFLTALAMGAVCVNRATADSLANAAYANDFDRRTSAKPIDPGKWHVFSYAVGSDEQTGGALVQGYEQTFDRKPFSFYGDNTQDGWIKPFIGFDWNTPSLRYTAGFSCRPDAAGGDNPYGQFAIGGGIGYYGTAIQPIYNAFSTGVVRMEIDIRVPSQWVNTTGNYYSRAMLLFQNRMNPDWNSIPSDYPAQLGINVGANEPTKSFLLFSRTDGGGLAGKTFDDAKSALTPGNWYRFVVDHDLDTHRLSGYALNLGAEHPTFTSNGTMLGELPSSGIYFAANPTSERGPVTGIGLICYGSRTDDDGFHADRASAYDNIRVSWKAPGKTDFEVCYENDFTTRRYRVLCPAGTTEADYAVTDPLATDSCSYANLCFLLPPSDTQEATRAQIPPPGIDGWRRHNSDGIGNFQVVGDTLSAVDSKLNWVAAAHPIGRKVTSGKVRYSADFRTPETWLKYPGIIVCLGGDKLYKSVQKESGYGNTSCADVGVEKGTSSTFVVCYSDATGDQKRQDKTLAAKTWYNVVATYDLDKGTYDYEIVKRSDGTSVDAQTGVQMRNNGVREISTLAIFAYSGAVEYMDAIQFSNLKVWVDVGTEKEEQVYSLVLTNGAMTRTRKVETPTEALVPALCDREGTDGWYRRYTPTGTGGLMLLGGDEPSLAVSAPASRVYAVQQSGLALKSGSFSFVCDIRPPCCWTGSDGFAGVVVGGDEYFQGNAQKNAYFMDAAFLRFAFIADGAADTCGFYRTTKAIVGLRTSAAASLTNQTLDATIDPTHWYRVTFANDATSGSTATVRLYDQGTAHPAASDSNGTLVATVTGAYLPYETLGKVTSHGIFAAKTQSCESYAAEDPGLALFDNFVWHRTPSGIIVIFR